MERNKNVTVNVTVIVDIPDDGYSRALVRKLERYFKDENTRLRDRGCKPISCEFRRRKNHHKGEG